MIKKNVSVIADKVDNTTMLCETTAVAFFRLNKTGAEIWEVCDNRSMDEIVSLVAKIYPKIKRAVLRSEVEQFVRSLSEAGLASEMSLAPVRKVRANQKR
jgi:hypothetical protein